jgi:uncharacterized membrane protein
MTEPRRAQTVVSAAVAAAAVLGYALLVHLTTIHAGHSALGALLTIGPIGLLALGLAWRSTQRLLGFGACLLVAALIAWYWRALTAHFVWFYLIQQVGLYGLLGISFGRTLGRGRVPLCTRVALLVHGTLPEDARRYTRRLTMVWTVFFVALTATMLLLFLAAPLAVWSAFANFGAVALVILLFLIENRVRRRLLPDMTHVSVIATIRASARGGIGAVEHRP